MDIKEIWRKFEKLVENHGESTILELLAQAMSNDELKENLEFICKELDEDFDEL